ncbi:NAD-dependent epimerase/dehydratase family protein [Caldisalinibacter kiritimatiensis]|uniref:UDP-glucose 4-epimerase n=1 Tax=Caldisalinibacter kiritimatiensis TaxID=1304284 RepID=R1CRU2_9FIRM|nr:NAD-dependent epimerase/dehydratase family protein [Caldisalinibacter kiritimatiensis]EOD01391.1 UDP-glucose 4-epimerase [Caldisalinibacter kiritimatiensis]
MIIVTGAAGFIGSNICEILLRNGYDVLGVDCYYDNYPKWIKKFHLRHCFRNPNFIFLESNILDPNISKLIEGLNITSIVHLADIPGVTTCSEVNFDEYIKYNITATQRLLETIKNKGVKKFIFISSSTVYGNVGKMPMSELTNPKPISLYGVTKLAGETLCHYYGHNYGMDIDILRIFTVYGPNQRPDMAFHKFIRSILLNEKIPVYGDGKQRRDFIYVEDIAQIILNIVDKKIDEEIINIAGGISLSVNESIKILEELLNKKAKVEYVEPKINEQIITHASMEKMDKVIKLDKKTDIYQGLKNEIEYIKKLYKLPD